ncbi:MAG: hypothetical protein RSF86_13385 [Angelakisella sp.]
MPVETAITFFDSPLFIALLGIVGAIIAAIFSHFLTVRHERSSKKTDDISALKMKNNELSEKLEQYEATEQSQTGDYLIMTKSGQAICPTCWGKEHKAVPIYGNDTGHFICGGCHTTGVYSRQLVERLAAEQEEANRELTNALEHMYDVPAQW